MANIYTDYQRVVITGGPRCGKTALANSYECTVMHTDDCMLDSIHHSAQHIARWFEQPAPWVIEGVTAGLALDRWLSMHQGKPCDMAIGLWTPLVKQSYEQKDMARYLQRRWWLTERELQHRGVEVLHNVRIPVRRQQPA